MDESKHKCWDVVFLMLNVVDLRGRTASISELRRTLPRGGTDVDSVLPVVETLVREGRGRGMYATVTPPRPCAPATLSPAPGPGRVA